MYDDERLEDIFSKTEAGGSKAALLTYFSVVVFRRKKAAQANLISASFDIKIVRYRQGRRDILIFEKLQHYFPAVLGHPYCTHDSSSS